MFLRVLVLSLCVIFLSEASEQKPKVGRTIGMFAKKKKNWVKKRTKSPISFSSFSDMSNNQNKNKTTIAVDQDSVTRKLDFGATDNNKTEVINVCNVENNVQVPVEVNNGAGNEQSVIPQQQEQIVVQDEIITAPVNSDLINKDKNTQQIKSEDPRLSWKKGLIGLTGLTLLAIISKYIWNYFKAPKTKRRQNIDSEINTQNN